MPPQPTPLFEDLLQRLASEHKREVHELRAEIVRLQGSPGRNEDGGSVKTKRKGSRGKMHNGSAVRGGNAFEDEESSKDGKMPEAPHRSPSPQAMTTAPIVPGDPVKPAMMETSMRKEEEEEDDFGMPMLVEHEPDQDALAAAYAVATEVSVDKELMDVVAPWSNENGNGEYGNGHSRINKEESEAMNLWTHLVHHIQHEVYKSELPKVHVKWNCDANPGFNLKNLIGVKNPEQEAHHHLKDILQDDEGHADASRGREVMREAYVKFAKVMTPTLPMHPNSKTRMVWDLLGIILLVHDLIMIPMLVYQTATEGLPEAYDAFIQKLDVVSAFFWTLDIVISFFTGFHSTAGFVEMRMCMIARNYMRSWFPMDMGIVSVDWATLYLSLGRASGFMRLGKTVSRIMRVARLLRFMKMSKQVSELMARINSEYILTAIGLVRLVVLIVIVNHYIACFWFGISQLPDKDVHSTWTEVHLDAKGFHDLSYSYFTSLHWSLTQFTPASMEVFPTNIYERVFNVVVIIAALVIFSSFVSSITNAMTHIRNINAQAVARDTMIRRYFSENNISHALAARVWHFVRQKRVAAGKRLKTEEIPILQQLPVRIRDELFQEVLSPVMAVHPMLHFYFRVCPAAMKKICKKGLLETSLAAGKEFKQDGDLKKMIFVVSGTLEFHIPEGAEEDGMDLVQIEQGEWVYEAVLWADRITVDGHLTAAPGGCDLLLLDAEVFRTVANENYDSLDILVKYATTFLERFTTDMQDEIAIRENLLFNDPAVAKEITLEATTSGERQRRSLMLRKASHSSGNGRSSASSH
mmetsp:Transcript_6713/g.15282  ORF Transcript_6713/g.15282 Transcript_6713/m.15282 type:complete len:808 (-) Transcript_6713:165-2588(-)